MNEKQDTHPQNDSPAQECLCNTLQQQLLSKTQENTLLKDRVTELEAELLSIKFTATMIV